MVGNRTSRRLLFLGWRGGVSVVGAVLTALLFPKLAPVWLLQFVGGVSSVVSPVAGYFVYCFGNREWIACALFTGGYIKEAVGEIEDEREFTEAEIEAFETFADDVASMSVAPAPSTTPIAGANVTAFDGQGGDGETLRTIRSRYRETVMSVPGYGSVYGDSVDESLAAEFGEELTVAIAGGGRFTEPVRGMILTQASTSAREREQHLEALAAERCSVVDARDRLGKLDPILERTAPRKLPQRSFEELIEYETDIGRATMECRQLLDDRQAAIHGQNGRTGRRSDRTSLQRYLYRPIETSFPVLSTALELISTLRDRRRAVVRSITRRY